jgi:sugar/nucleoside kinase (ribokinase family)
MPQRAARLTASHLPKEWQATPLVLLGPVAGELDDSLAASFRSSFLAVGAQGWLRTTTPDGAVKPVYPEDWDEEPILRHASALFLSDEDLPPESAEEALKRWCGTVEIVAFTRGYDGADICYRDEWRHIEAFPVEAVDPTGAGDIFAAAFLIRLAETKDVWDAARFASCAASFVVEGEGVAAVPGRQQVEARLQENPVV